MQKLIYILLLLILIIYNCSEKITESEDEQEPEKIITQIMFVEDDNDMKNVGIIDNDGQNKKTIISQIRLRNLNFSTDGNKITYKNESDGEIYIADIDGTNLNLILDDLWGVFNVKLLSKRNLLYIAAYETDGTASVHIWDITKNIRTKIIDHEGCMEYISVSPDEELIFFSLKCDALYIMNWDGENRKKIFNGWCLSPINYSLDGLNILFSMRNSGDFEIIYTGDSSGENIKAVTNDSLHVDMTAFSPDATKIVFADNYSLYTNQKLCLINSDGTNSQIIYSSEYRIFNPQFTHDGLKIIFEMNNAIYSINTDGSELNELVPNAKYPLIRPITQE